MRARGRFASGDVPTFYYLGGPASLRGYPSYILNGTYSVLLNQEWRFPILRPNPYLTGVASLLAGGIWGGAGLTLMATFSACWGMAIMIVAIATSSLSWSARSANI